MRDGPRRFPRDFSCPAVLRNLSTEPDCFRLQDCHLLWSHFPEGSTNNPVYDSAALRPNRPYNPREQALWFGLFRVRSPLLAESLTCFLFLQVLRWFTSLRCLPHAYEFSVGYSGINQSGFPHSEIPGSKPACGSPGLIAACHVLHRLLVPRHSPYALSSLTKCSLTHCVCVVKELPIAGYSVVKESALRGSRLRRARCRPPPILSSSFGAESAFALRAAAACRACACRTVDASLALACQPKPRLHRERRLVENTGLEPVTSWLQTRRSPS